MTNKAVFVTVLGWTMSVCLFGGQLSCQGKRSGAGQPTLLPGAEPFEPDLKQRLAAKVAGFGKEYKPRTRHLRSDGSAEYTNRLVLESSPYLRQHAHNPVNWYPWGEEAFAAAKRLGRPILLSIGYSTCHWCHVMEEESFEDEEIARYLNENYVAIKVDREERPDVDSIYMAAVQAMGIGGGWPLNVWLTQDREPFFGGTYFPPRAGVRGSRTGFIDVLQKIRKSYSEQPESIAGSTKHIVAMLRRAEQGAVDSSLPDETLLARATDHYKSLFDSTYGGLARGGRGTKFPSSLPIRLLLRQYRRTKDNSLVDMASLTLEKMAAGGMRDHIGGGFHRYSTDAKWLVPHFEKMLYDNALLAVAYLEAYQMTGRQDFSEMVREILRYVAREMTSPEGLFYSATDADSATPDGHSEEGYFFTWTPVEIDKALDAKAAALIKQYYDVSPAGNFEGRSIANTPWPLHDVATDHGLTVAQAREIITASNETLRRVRGSRPPPLRDDKALTAWNALMISAYARAARVLKSDGELDYAQVAAKAAKGVLAKLRRDGRLLRAYRDGQGRLNAYLADYAFLIAALLDLFEATADPVWLDEALALDDVLAERYEDAKGGFFMTSNDHESLLTRMKPEADRAIPSGNSYAVMNLLRLYELTSEPAYLERAERALKAFGPAMRRAPESHAELLLALDFRLDAAKEVVIVAPESMSEAKPFIEKLAGTFLPNHVLVVTVHGPAQEELAKRVPLVKHKAPMGGKVTAYVCEGGSCKLPTSDPEVFQTQLAPPVISPARPAPP